LLALRTPRRRQAAVRSLHPSDGGEGKLIQRSMVEKGAWEVKQTADTIVPSDPDYNAKIAHGQDRPLGRDGDGKLTWGGQPDPEEWRQSAPTNKKRHELHRLPLVVEPELLWLPPAAEGEQEDAQPAQRRRRLAKPRRLQLPDAARRRLHAGPRRLVTGNRINPARSSCAIHVSSYNNNRESIYHQQQTISAERHVGHRVQHQRAAHGARRRMAHGSGSGRAGTTKPRCAPTATFEERQQRDHGPAADAGDQLSSTSWASTAGSPPASMGWKRSSSPKPMSRRRSSAARCTANCLSRAVLRARRAAATGARPRASGQGHRRAAPATDSASRRSCSLQARGEYLYAACGAGGLRVFDIAFIDHKGFSRADHDGARFAAGPAAVRPTKYATAVAAPTTLAPDPTREQMPENHEQPCIRCMPTFTSPTNTRG
jgi:hypothetical protein